MDMIRVGYVSAVDKDSGMVSVVYPGNEDATTDFLPYLSPGNEYFPPKVDDMVLVAYHSEGAQGICLGTYWNKENTPPCVNGAYKKYSDNSYVQYDKDRDVIILSATDILLKCGDKVIAASDLAKE